MPANYTAFNGDAGMITVKLFRRSDNVQVGTTGLRIYNFGFNEEDEESESNEIFTNINDKLIKDFYGYRKRINFSLVNAANVPSPTSSTNASMIKAFISCINLIIAHPLEYRMQIQYRANNQYGIIMDAICVGNFKLKELKEDANVAQVMNFEFVSACVQEPINLGYAGVGTRILLEDETGVIITEMNDGGAITCETEIDFVL